MSQQISDTAHILTHDTARKRQITNLHMVLQGRDSSHRLTHGTERK